VGAEVVIQRRKQTLPPHVRRLIRRGADACKRAGLRVPPLDVRIVARLPHGWIGATELQPDGVVRIRLTPEGCEAAVVAHEIAHAILEPIALESAEGHDGTALDYLWGVLNSLLYRALVE